MKLVVDFSASSFESIDQCKRRFFVERKSEILLPRHDFRKFVFQFMAAFVEGLS